MIEHSIDADTEDYIVNESITKEKAETKKRDSIISIKFNS